MEIYGIIAEYNPFHNGHKMHIEAARASGATHIVAIMGGNFLQRGDCAIMDKHMRAKAALEGGANLVVELPLPYACATAERFAFGGVGIADALGCVKKLSFGSECGSTQLITEAARAVDNPKVLETMKSYLDEGLTFARARQLAVAECVSHEVSQVLSEPNNTLGVEYTRQLIRMGSSILTHTIARVGAGHNSMMPADNVASASLVRRLIHENGIEHAENFLPLCSALALKEAVEQYRAPASLSRLERAMLAKLRMMSAEQFARLPDISEGLENRLAAAVRTSASLAELYEKLKTKRYTLSRLRRIVLAAFIGIDGELCRKNVPYIRVLGFNEKGKEVLALAKQTSRLPISHSLARLQELGGDAEIFARLEGISGDIFSLATPYIQPCGSEYTKGLIKA